MAEQPGIDDLTNWLGLRWEAEDRVRLTIRPEVRYDCSLNNTRPFNNSSDRDQFTTGIDFVLTF